MACLARITRPRFLDTELGYQGELLAELRNALPGCDLPGDAVVEQEYQKRLRDHGINVRPDIIVHVQTPPAGDPRRDNFVVLELNHQAGPTEVREDFHNLDTVLGALNYPLGIFINVGSGRTQAQHYRGPFRNRVHFFAVRLRRGALELKHAYFENGVLVEE